MIVVTIQVRGMSCLPPPGTNKCAAGFEIEAFLVPAFYVVLLMCFSGSLLAQPACAVGPVPGNTLGNKLRITDNANNCTCANNYTQPFTLHLLESGQPSLRFTSNGPTTAPACTGDIHTTLSLNRGGAPYSTLEGTNDFSIVVDQTAANLILSTRDPGSAIKFATTPPAGGDDVERMRITTDVRIGIAQMWISKLLIYWVQSSDQRCWEFK